MGIGRRLRHPLIPLCLAVLALGLYACGSDDPESAAPEPAVSEAAFERAPGPLRALYEERNELLGGGERAFRERLEGLRGHPVVVNKWASWCGPCRAEFPFFQRQSVRRAREVAFIGVNSLDNDGSARDFLEEFPVTYPSYKDPDQKVAGVFDGVAAFPSTAFYDSRGKLQYLKQGGYPRESKLAEDIERYAR
jgi:cytochrome c biogenesis protein CcmG/thiol:disulfide interchange protein DsbE